VTWTAIYPISPARSRLSFSECEFDREVVADSIHCSVEGSLHLTGSPSGSHSLHKRGDDRELRRCQSPAGINPSSAREAAELLHQQASALMTGSFTLKMASSAANYCNR